MTKSENNLVAWIADRFAKPAEAEDPLLLGIGDDMAMFKTGSGGLLVASDMIMDGVDFNSTVHSPEQIGRKALAINLSDCAAMAVKPRYALVSLALPNAWSMEQAQRLFIGMEELARRFDVRIIGGDTNSWDRPLVIDVTVLAEPWPGIAPIQRGGMEISDLICVTGPLGGSLTGHHLKFEPRVVEAKWLAETYGPGLHAMMDLSDGLSSDAARMGAAAGLGIELLETNLEIIASESAQAMAARRGGSAVEHVLNDGEDFELLYAVDAQDHGRIHRHDNKDLSHRFAIEPAQSVIGRVVKEKGLWLQRKDGAREPIEPRGWQHFQ